MAESADAAARPGAVRRRTGGIQVASLEGYGAPVIDIGHWFMESDLTAVVGVLRNFVPERIAASTGAMTRFNIDDGDIFIGEYASGAICSVQSSFVTVGNYPGIEVRVYGNEGAAIARLVEERGICETLHIASPDEVEFREIEIPASYYPPGGSPRESWRTLYYANLTANFASEVLGELPGNEGNFDDGLWVQEVINAVELSHRERRWVSLPLDGAAPGAAVRKLGDTGRVLAAARQTGTLLWEAFVFPFHEQMARIRELVAGGAIGEPMEIKSNFHFQLSNPGNIRYSRRLEGGALNDVGCYPIRLAAEFFGVPHEAAWAGATWGGDGVDVDSWGCSNTRTGGGRTCPAGWAAATTPTAAWKAPRAALPSATRSIPARRTTTSSSRPGPSRSATRQRRGRRRSPPPSGTSTRCWQASRSPGCWPSTPRSAPPGPCTTWPSPSSTGPAGPRGGAGAHARPPDPGARYRRKTVLMVSLMMRAPTAVAAPPITPLVIVSLWSVPNFRACATTGSAAAWKPLSKAPLPLTAS